MNRLLTLAAVALLAAPAPAQAQVGTAAFWVARDYCRARSAGLSEADAVRVASEGNFYLWRKQMTDPAFIPLAAVELKEQCPQYFGRP